MNRQRHEYRNDIRAVSEFLHINVDRTEIAPCFCAIKVSDAGWMHADATGYIV